MFPPSANSLVLLLLALRDFFDDENWTCAQRVVCVAGESQKKALCSDGPPLRAGLQSTGGREESRLLLARVSP